MRLPTAVRRIKKVTYIAGSPSIIKGFFRVDARSFTFVRTIFKSTTSWITPFPRRTFLEILRKNKNYWNKNLAKKRRDFQPWKNMKHTKEKITQTCKKPKNKQKQDRHSPHNGYKYKSLFTIIIKICLACIGF